MISLANYSFCILLALAGAPLLHGIINRIKAAVAGRQGPSVFQLYYDIFKLLHKQPVCSCSATWIFRWAPSIVLVSHLMALLLLPLAGAASPWAFPGDMLLFLYFLGTARLFTVLAALDTGSAFEGMGASRESQFALLGEGAFLAVFGALALKTGSLSLNGLLNLALWTHQGACSGIALALLLSAFFCIILLECCRVPVDDPETHLELTMIHEVMILDNSGYDLALTHYAAALKMWLLLAVFSMVALPPLPTAIGTIVSQLVIILAGASLIGVVESVVARSRFLKLPTFLAAASVLAILAIILL